MDAPTQWNLPSKWIEIMASTYVRLGLLTAACLMASRGEAQDAAPSYTGYGTPLVSQPSGQGSYGYNSTSLSVEPQIAYPQTVNSPSPYRNPASGDYPIVQFPTTVPATTTSTLRRTPSTGAQNTGYPGALGPNSSVLSAPPYQGQGAGSTAAYSQMPNSVNSGYYNPTATAPFPVAQPGQVFPQYASMGDGTGGMYPPGVGPTPGAPLPIPAEPYYGPSVGDHTLAGCDQFGCGAPVRQFFMTYDYLYWTVTPPKTTKIGSTQLEGDYTRGGVTTHFENSLDTSFIDTAFSSGHRVEFGARDCYTGWLVGFAYAQQTQGLTSNSVNFLPGDPGFPDFSQTYLAGYTDGNGDGIDDDLNSNTFYGRFGEDLGTPDGMGGYNPPLDGTPDAPAPTDTGDLQIYLPVFTQASVQNTLTMSNLELMHMTRMNQDPASDFEFLYGARFLDLRDYFSFSGTGGTLDATSLAVTSKNHLLGLQVGARWRKSFGVWLLNAEGRFLAAANIQDNQMYGNVASNILTNSNGQNGPVNLNPQSFNYSSSNNEWAPVGELRLQAILPINDCCAFRLGYTGFVASGISRASEKVDYVLPRFGMNQTASNETILFNSFNLGFEFNR